MAKFIDFAAERKRRETKPWQASDEYDEILCVVIASSPEEAFEKSYDLLGFYPDRVWR